MRTRPQWVLAVAVAVIAVAALVTVVLTWRHPVHVTPGTPEATVQKYVDAVLGHDSEAAMRMLAPDSPCDVEDLDRTNVGDDLRVSLRDVVVLATTARVEVDITSGSGGLLPDQWTERQTFRLVRSDSQWRITGAPWPLFGCGGLK